MPRLDAHLTERFNRGMSAMHFHISRRSFIKSAALAGGLPAWFLSEQLLTGADATVKSPNDRPGILLVGCGGMGRGDAANASRFGDVVAVCDVDSSRAAAAAQQFSKSGKKVSVFTDFRKAMQSREIQVVINGTPDHWHTLVNLAAAKAGKDVYSEKPLTLTIEEGRRLATAVRQHKIVLQTGSQQRSDGRFRLACELVRNGRLGKLKQVVVYLPAGLREGPFKSQLIPEGFNWDLYQGQAPKTDYMKERTHTTFRYWLDYSGGTMTDWGAHHNDIARWAIGLKGPKSVRGKILAEPIPGGYTAPSEYEVEFTYANGVRHLVRSTPNDSIYGGVVKKEGQRNGIRFEGEKGWIWVTRGDMQASDEELVRAPLASDAKRLPVSNDHMGNFFECIRTRAKPIANVDVGHRSASICHLGVIALRLGIPLKWDLESERFVGEGSEAANKLIAREQRAPYDYSYIS